MLLPVLAALAASSGSLWPPTAERWGVWEANLTLPTATFANPFLDVELQATFKLVAPGDGGSVEDDPAIFGHALSPSEIVAVQHRSGCAPSCGENACGSDGCGGSCGTCSYTHVCGNRGGGPRRCQSRSTLTVAGFYDGGDDFKLRFSPPFTGRWSFTTHSNIPALSNHKGEITVGPAPAGQHGPVESLRTRFAHADGTPYFSVGSTSYQVRVTHHS